MLSHSFSHISYCFSNPDCPDSNPLSSSDSFHSVAPSFPLQHFHILTSVSTCILSYFLSNPRNFLLAKHQSLLLTALLFTTQTLQSPWLGPVFCPFYFLAFSLHLSPSWRAGISILKKKHKLTGLNPQGGFMDSRRSVEQEARAAMRDQPLEG